MNKLDKWNKQQLTALKIRTYLSIPACTIMGLIIISASLISFENSWGLTLFGIGFIIFGVFACIINYKHLRNLENESAEKENEFEKYKKFYEENKDKIE